MKTLLSLNFVYAPKIIDFHPTFKNENIPNGTHASTKLQRLTKLISLGGGDVYERRSDAHRLA